MLLLLLVVVVVVEKLLPLLLIRCRGLFLNICEGAKGGGMLASCLFLCGGAQRREEEEEEEVEEVEEHTHQALDEGKERPRPTPSCPAKGMVGGVGSN